MPQFVGDHVCEHICGDRDVAFVQDNFAGGNPVFGTIAFVPTSESFVCADVVIVSRGCMSDGIKAGFVCAHVDDPMPSLGLLKVDRGGIPEWHFLCMPSELQKRVWNAVEVVKDAGNDVIRCDQRPSQRIAFRKLHEGELRLSDIIADPDPNHRIVGVDVPSHRGGEFTHRKAVP